MGTLKIRKTYRDYKLKLATVAVFLVILFAIAALSNLSASGSLLPLDNSDQLGISTSLAEEIKYRNNEILK